MRICTRLQATGPRWPIPCTYQNSTFQRIRKRETLYFDSAFESSMTFLWRSFTPSRHVVKFTRMFLFGVLLLWNVLAFFIQLCWRASARAGFVLWEKTYEFSKSLRFFSYSSWLRSRLNLLRVTSREGHDLIVHPGKMGWNTVDHGRGCISGRSPTCRLNRGTSCLFVRPEQIFQRLPNIIVY